LKLGASAVEVGEASVVGVSSSHEGAEPRYVGMLKVRGDLGFLEVELALYSPEDGRLVRVEKAGGEGVFSVELACPVVIPRPMSKLSATLVLPSLKGVVKLQGGKVVVE